MGNRDTAEQLKAAIAECVRLERELAAAQAVIAEARSIHDDAGESQGFMASGYGFIDHTCGACGTHGEYGESWPCKTRIALDRADSSALAAAIREAKAEALREAADGFWARLPGGAGNGRAYNSYTVARVLRDLATDAEREGADHAE